MASDHSNFVLRNHTDGMRPAPGLYRADAIEIGEDGWPLTYRNLRPYREHAPARDKWGRLLG